MHEYLEAIGFSGLKFRKHLKMLLSDVEESYDHEEIVPFALDMDWCERRKEYGETIGISIFGELDENSKFEKTFMFLIFAEQGSHLMQMLPWKNAWKTKCM